MASIVQFRPRAEVSARENYFAFVSFCEHNLTTFGADLPFHLDEWDLSHVFRRKGTNTKVKVSFNDWEATRSRSSKPMSDPIKSLAKAYFRYNQATNLTSSFAGLILAFRALEVSLREYGMASEPWSCTADVLSRASQLLANRYSAAGSYHAGRELEKLAKFMCSHELIVVPMDWRNPHPRGSDTQKVGEEFDQQRREKLPSPAALNAMAQIFRMATSPGDRLVSSLVAILCSAPDRINEVLRLPIDCEVHDRIPSTGMPTYGLRWYTSKAGDPMVKWIVGSMVEVVQEAIANIKSITNDARIVAHWYEANPTKLYIRPEHEYLRSQEWISTNEIGQLVFESNPGQESIRQWLYLRGIPIVRRGSDYGVVKFADIEKTIVSLLPRNFPFIDKEIGLKYSNALCTFFRNTFHLSRCVYSCVVDVIEQNDVASRIGGERHRSIFHRFDFKEDDGSPIRLRSHQLRHYLNTLAQSGGLSQLDIAKWSGRRDIKQNNSYDHVSDRDVLAQVRAATPNSAAQLSVKPAVLARAKFQSLGISVAHTTEFGYCVHDFAMLPCQLHADCINCDEQVCVKGDIEREINVRLQLEETRSLLALAASASRQGDIGAARWQAHQQMTLERLEELCKLIDDPMIPVGSVIKLSPSNAQSRMKLAFSKRIELKEAAK
ncbi:integrase [Polaromonas sp.]|uniref:integrase n=1 Tax=Polaromonas sp. TaxID=1869339 RepID=UPI002731BD2B|nr:integrase [Polaromonas sp.]MDP2449559.1 integrase [Polaromonas sp.]